MSSEDHKVKPGGGAVAQKIREQLGIGSVAKSADSGEVAQSGGPSTAFQAGLAQARQQLAKPGSAPVGQAAHLRKQIEGTDTPNPAEESVEKAAPTDPIRDYIRKAAQGYKSGEVVKGEDALTPPLTS